MDPENEQNMLRKSIKIVSPRCPQDHPKRPQDLPTTSPRLYFGQFLFLNSKQTSHYLLRKVDAAELHYKHKSEDTNHKNIRRTSKIIHDSYGLDRPIGMYVIT